MSFSIQSGIDDGFAAAAANGFQFRDGVRDFQQTGAAGEQFCAEVCPQTIAEHRYIISIHNVPKLVNLFRLEELSFICDDDIIELFFPFPFLEQCKQIHIRCHHISRGFQTDAAFHHTFAISGIYRRLHEPYLHVLFLVIELGNQCLRRLGTAHGAISKIQFCHAKPSFFLYCPIIISQNLPSGEVKNGLSQKINNTKLFQGIEKVDTLSSKVHFMGPLTNRQQYKAVFSQALPRS